MTRNYFHLHLVSDSTGETLIAVSRAVVAQYQGTVSIEHVYPLVRNADQLARVINEIQSAPGIVLYTLVDEALSRELQAACAEFGAVSLSVLEPIVNLFHSYLGPSQSPRPGAQHTLNSEYFRRIEALNYTMAHDDGQMVDEFEDADVVILGVSRTSKTPTSIYLANRGIKTANLPLVPGAPIPPSIFALRRPLVVGLLAAPERIVQIRENRLLSLNVADNTSYVDRAMVSDEIAQSRRLFNQRNWPMIDVTRRSIEETAAAIMDLYRSHQLKFMGE
ncbi:regulator of PEP synthase PpsR (kinase-PPPase family) [Rhodoblastus acidophilus]|uniref:pyruvate, water dikinase regulatory protein n=1 Tax=Rhodoblastus acidophilus TaxID=1074 RepID=UPI0016081E03|nr:pyruvate, water dikinase regulatory protein [Rhodoblastus acidophilus]MCW2282803.1 regulator of PEP synthase PpsR (kinase-PPPase family) [Rhodoblastus acidophilus]MCW2331664.1 regulator of PEP synthase PpsR (kinase-PPPase family) [Rhodoblastus acidophilus]